MKQILFRALFVLAAGALTIPSLAQNKNDEIAGDSEAVTIRKTGPVDGKMTIVIDGNDVTVNGIPVDDFKSKNIEVTKGANTYSASPFFRSIPRSIESNKAFLGVMTEAADKGALVKDVTEKSPAQKAGLKEGDIITKVENDKIDDANDLYKAIGKYKPEDKVSITYLRDGKEYQTQVTLAKNDQVKVYGFGNEGNPFFNFQMPDLRNIPELKKIPLDRFGSNRPRLGLQVQDLSEGKGVKVVEVVAGEAGEKNGIQKGDIITELNGKTISGVDDIQDAMNSVSPGDTISVTYNRNGKTATTKISFPKKLKTSDI